MKNLGVTGLVSTSILEPIFEQLFNSGMEKLADDASYSLGGKFKVFVDGDWIGVCKDSLSFVSELRRKRRRKELPTQVPFNYH